MRVCHVSVGNPRKSLYMRPLVIDFRRKQPVHIPLYIEDTDEEIVPHIKFLGVHVANNLTWSLHTSSTIKKAHQHLHFLRRLKRAHLSPSILTTFYRGTIESVLTSCMSLWHESSSSDVNAILEATAKGEADRSLQTMTTTIT